MRHFDYLVNGNIKTRSTSSITGGEAASFLYDPEGNRKYVTVSERAAFLRAVEQRPPEIRSFCRLLAYTGARISEILALTPNNINVAAGVIIIESLKKRRRGIYRAVPIPLELLAELEQTHHIDAVQRDVVQATAKLWPWCRTTAWHYIKVCMEEAQIVGRQGSPKGLRHGFGVGVLQAGVPLNLLKKWLGHSRLSTTEIYAEAVGAEEQAIAERYWRTFESPGLPTGVSSST